MEGGGDWPPCGCPFHLLELQHVGEVGAQCCFMGSIGMCGDAFWGYLGRSRSSGRLLHLVLCSHDGDSSKGSVLFGRDLLKELLGDKSTVCLPFTPWGSSGGSTHTYGLPSGGVLRENQTCKAKVCKEQGVPRAGLGL